MTTSVICASIILFVVFFPVIMPIRNSPISIDEMPILRFMGVGLKRTIIPAIINIIPMTLLLKERELSK